MNIYPSNDGTADSIDDETADHIADNAADDSGDGTVDNSTASTTTETESEVATTKEEEIVIDLTEITTSASAGTEYLDALLLRQVKRQIEQIEASPELPTARKKRVTSRGLMSIVFSPVLIVQDSDRNSLILDSKSNQTISNSSSQDLKVDEMIKIQIIERP